MSLSYDSTLYRSQSTISRIRIVKQKLKLNMQLNRATSIYAYIVYSYQIVTIYNDICRLITLVRYVSNFPFPYFVYFSIKYQHSQWHSNSIYCYIGNRFAILQNIVYLKITHARTFLHTPPWRPIATQITSCI